MQKERNRATLPKWAQNELARLERDLEYTRAKLAQAPDDSRVFANPYSDAPQPLGDADVEFRVNDHDKFKVGLDDVRDGTVLTVYGGDTLQIEPQASNVVRVRLRRF